MILLFIIVLLISMMPMYHHPKIISNFITLEECSYIKRKVSDKLKPSTVSIGSTLNESVRKSETAWLEKTDPVVRRIIEKCGPIENCEKLQVIRYTRGGFYKPHQDALKCPNPRIHTFILALNDDYIGGGTEFPNLGKTYHLKMGDALSFDTLDTYGMITSKALHGGKPVETGEKWICNVWVHKFNYSI